MNLLTNPRPVVAVVGSGAVGGFYGARLVRAGAADVHFLMRSDFDAVRANGLTIRSHEGDFALPPDALNVYRDPADMPKPDLVLIALKATNNSAYESLIRPLLRDDTVLLTLQNGLGNEDALADLFGVERVLGGMAFVCIHRLAPGVIHHMDHGFLKVGEYVYRGTPSPGVTGRVRRVAGMWQAAGIRCDALDDLRRGRWEKLVWNIPFNGLGAAMDLATDRLIGSESGLALVRRLMAEVCAAAAADGAPLAPDLIDRQISNTKSMGAYQSSMQIDRNAGRPLEVEAILGEPLRRAVQLGVRAPTLQAIYEMVRMVNPRDV